MADTTTLVCPKCGGEMRSQERSGITIDRCTECRGVFLDRGELERLIDAEAAYAEAEARPQGREGSEPEEEPGGRRRGRFGFLGDLFEGD